MYAPPGVVAAPIDEAGVIYVGGCARSAATSSTLVAPSPIPANAVAVVSTVSQTPHGGIHTTGRCLCASSRPRAGGQALSSESPIEGIA